MIQSAHIIRLKITLGKGPDLINFFLFHIQHTGPGGALSHLCRLVPYNHNRGQTSGKAHENRHEHHLPSPDSALMSHIDDLSHRQHLTGNIDHVGDHEQTGFVGNC